MQRWFCSDHHLGHWNIIKYSNRPFTSLAEMHDTLVERHNAVVKPNDHVSFLGDVTIKRGGRLDKEWFIKEMRRYNGHKRLYLGNHDHFPIKVYLEAGFEKVYATWRDEERFLFSHIPVHPKSLGSAIANVHGHTHTQPNYPPVVIPERGLIKPYINICVEQTDYRPVSIDEIKARVDREVKLLTL